MQNKNMGVFGKLAFWKKREENLEPNLGLGQANLGIDLQSPNFSPNLGMQEPDLGLQQDNLGLDMQNQQQQYPNQQQFNPFGSQNYTPRNPGNGATIVRQTEQQFPFQQNQNQPQQLSQHQMLYNKDIELLYAKLDTIRASIEIVNQRLSNIERSMQSQNQNNEMRRRMY